MNLWGIFVTFYEEILKLNLLHYDYLSAASVAGTEALSETLIVLCIYNNNP